MFLFLLAYLLIYGIIQVVFYLRIQAILPEATLFRLSICFFLVLMMAAPILSRLLEKNGQISLATGLAWIGYSWMGFVFLAFCLGLAFFIMEAGLGLGAKLFQFKSIRPSPKWTAIFILLVCLVLSLYGFYESRQLRLERLQIPTRKLPQGSELTLVQISDVHLGLMINDKYVQKIVQYIQEIEPDILLCTGDLVDGNLEGLRRLAPVWAKLSPPQGSYAVSGNHEKYIGLEDAFSFLRKAGFQALNDKMLEVTDSVTLVGLDYSWKRRCPIEDRFLKRIDPEKFVLLLKHSPQVCSSSLGRFDLQLSGHTHNGQIFPFNLIVKIFYPYISGLYSLENDSKIYVNRGTGTWGPQIRIFSPPEITVIKIRGSRS